MIWNKLYKVIVKNGKGIDNIGIERDYSKFLKNGIITLSIPNDSREYPVFYIDDLDTGEHKKFDFGKLQGKAVIPIRVKVWFGKADNVEIGYQMRRDGSYYHSDIMNFRRGHNKKFQKSRLCELMKAVERTDDGTNLGYGWLLSDATKDAIAAELKEATSGKYKYEIVWDKI